MGPRGDERYGERAKAELMSGASFSDWNPSHWLDVAELATATAIGLDWLQDRLTPEQRELLVTALIEKCLRHAVDEQGLWTATNNWNQVCLTGVMVAAWAAEEREPELARRMLERVQAHLENDLKAYIPDGLPDEGPAYWSYGGTYSAIMFSAIDSAGRGDIRALVPAHLIRSAEVRAMLDGPSGQWFGYSDNFGLNRLEPGLFFFAAKENRPEWLAATWRLIGDLESYVEQTARGNPVRLWLLPLALVWAPPESAGDPKLPRAWSGRGRSPIALLREFASPGDPGAFVGLKGGSPSVSHAHMDQGSFVIDLDQTRWALDLGAEDYGPVEAVIGGGLWDMSQNSPRWQLLRYHNLQHNTLTIGGELQRVSGRGEVVRTGESPWPFAVLELSSLYDGQAQAVVRGVRLSDSRTVEIVDHVRGMRADQDLTWTWMTDATVARVTPGVLTLSKDGRSATLAVLEPSGADFTVAKVDELRKPHESANPGVSAVRLVLRGSSEHRILVRITTADPGSLPAAAWCDPAGWPAATVP